MASSERHARLVNLVDYDKHYVKGPGQCGEPFSEFVAFFEHYDKKGATVLDLGCGQGRVPTASGP